MNNGYPKFVPYTLDPVTGGPVAEIEIPLDPTVALPGDADAARKYSRVTWDDVRQSVRQRQRSDRLAAKGEWLATRELDDLDALLVGPAVGEFFAAVLPDRAASRARARLVIDRLRDAGHVVEYRHLAARCEPDPPAELAAVWAELQPYLCDALQSEGSDDGRGDQARPPCVPALQEVPR